MASRSVGSAKAHFAECVRKAESGEPVVITRYGRPVAAIVPAGDVDAWMRLKAVGPEGGLASLAGRFDDLADFADELDRIVAERDRRNEP